MNFIAGTIESPGVTKTRILDAAERLLSERGFASSSLRAITAAAGVNLGAVNYHFRSKEALIQSVFARRLGPINRERLAALDACEAKAGRNPVPLDELLSAFIDPVLRSSGDGMVFLRLLGRMYFEPSLDLQRIFRAELGMVVERFRKAFHRALPDLSPEDIFWRLFFSIGAMAQMLASAPLLEFISGGICDPSDTEDARERLVGYVRAGLSAPAAGSRHRKKRRSSSHPFSRP